MAGTWPVAHVTERLAAPPGIRPPMARHTVGIMGRDLDIDNSRAKEELGWSTRVSYPEAMEEISGWVRDAFPDAYARRH